MKKLFIALLLAFLPSVMMAQNSLFSKFEDKAGVTSVIVNKKMFELMSGVKMDPKDKDAQRYLNLVKKLDNLKVFTTSSPKYAADMKATVDSYLKSTALDELMRINEGGRSIKIYVKQNAGQQVKELLMFIDGGGKDETVLMSLTGTFDLDDISVLTDKMNLPGGAELNKAAKKQKS
ncbi:DUF4252 domain-containing protein [Flavobacterium sp. RHBU_3]|uniref:DUF4252 domain-containing protein n=1 Tax=Flavobacterium sp. RHBU_3 TaxID=3391184 RepID=UPI0039849E9F